MSQVLIDYYKAIEDSSVKMLEAAKAEDWDGVVRYETACAVLIEQLRHRARSEEMTPAKRKEKAQIMQRGTQAKLAKFRDDLKAKAKTDYKFSK